jgi:ribosomal protein S1
LFLVATFRPCLNFEEKDLKINIDSLFFSGEVVSGMVINLQHRFALIEMRGYKLPLETHLMSWGSVIEPSSVVETGERIKVMVLTQKSKIGLRRSERPILTNKNSDFWLSRLPLLDNPWQALERKYPDGSVIEVELVDYDRSNDAFVKLPERVMAKVPMITLQRYARLKKQALQAPLIGDSFRVIVHGKLSGNFWLQPHIGRTVHDDLVLSEYRASLKCSPLSNHSFAG